MTLTVENLKLASKKASRTEGSVYIIESSGKIDIIVNSAGTNAVCSCNNVIKHLTRDSIDYDNCVFKNTEMNLRELCDTINSEYLL